jgi:uncharacterized SAM-binding protein YcdF (DUF218 family)
VLDSRIHSLAERLWHYHQLQQPLTRSDAILVLGSHDEAVAERGAEVFLEGWAPLLIFSGGFGTITRHLWHEPEADRFAAIAMTIGVPADRILIENQSTNTGENVQFTRRLLEEKQLSPERFILVQKPYMERRAYATFMRQWPGKTVTVTSPRASFDEYLNGYANRALSHDDVVAIMVGDLQRVRVYADMGYQIPQEIPDDVWSAFEQLVEGGYDKYLIRP